MEQQRPLPKCIFNLFFFLDSLLYIGMNGVMRCFAQSLSQSIARPMTDT